MRTSLFDLSGQRIWVFGGAGYLGRAVVTTLHDQKADVSCIDLEDKASTFVSGSEFSSRVRPVSLDLSHTEQVLTWIRSECVADRVPQGVVFMTTPMSNASLEQLTHDDLTSYNEIGLSALFCAVREIGTALASAGGGSVVLFSSMYSLVAPDPRVYEPPMIPNPIQYGMQKAAINQMTRYLAVTWGKYGVRCNAVIPGAFPNTLVQKNHPEFVSRLAEKIPMERIGSPEEIAGAVAFLISPAATFVNGHGLVVDGGWTAW